DHRGPRLDLDRLFWLERAFFRMAARLPGAICRVLRRPFGGFADGGAQCFAHFGEAVEDSTRHPASVDGHGFWKSGGFADSMDSFLRGKAFVECRRDRV